MNKCKIHHQYKGIRKPTSTKAGCTCMKIWKAKEKERNKLKKIKEKELKAKEKKEAIKQAEWHRQQKMHEIAEVYASIANKNNSVHMLDMIDAGISKDTVSYYYGNLSRLNKVARTQHPDMFFDKAIEDLDTEENQEKTNKALKRCKRFLVTTAVTGCKISSRNLKAMENYCKKNNAHIFVLISSDPAHNQFAPGARYGSVDTELVNSEYTSIIFNSTKLNSNITLSDLKINAKQIDGTAGMKSIAATKGSFVFASPKQHLGIIPTKKTKFPYAIMSTGAITMADYTTTSYASNRTAFIATNKHVLGGLILEIEDDEIYHYRQFQNAEDGSFIDICVQYNADGTTEDVYAILVGGDWHSGMTDPTSIAAKVDMSKKLKIKAFVKHDGFDGASVNHHEDSKRALKYRRYTHSKASLFDEIQGYVNDLNMMCKHFDEIIIVKSNHDQFLDRWLDDKDITKDPVNGVVGCQLFVQYAHYKEDPIKYAVNNIDKLASHNPDGVKTLQKPKAIKWLKIDEDYFYGGIQLGDHGHLGANGARGGIKGFDTSLPQSMSGHSHTPGIYGGVWKVGTSTYLDLHYNNGQSSWMHTDGLVYPNGSRQLINIINGKWKL